MATKSARSWVLSSSSFHDTALVLNFPATKNEVFIDRILTNDMSIQKGNKVDEQGTGTFDDRDMIGMDGHALADNRYLLILGAPLVLEVEIGSAEGKLTEDFLQSLRLRP